MRVTERLWYSRSLGGRAGRLLLAPASLGYWAGSLVRQSCYRTGLCSPRPLTAPSISIGNLEVGGTGKTPFAGWLAERYLTLNVTPGIVHNGYADDEVTLHRATIDGAVVTGARDRLRAAEAAVERGAGVLILDDAFQTLSIRADLNVALLSAESWHATRWPLPAGPWREGITALSRADYVVVTRKSASLLEASRWREKLRKSGVTAPIGRVRLRISGFRFLLSNKLLTCSAVYGFRVLALAGVGAPQSFGEQLRALGAEVTLCPRPDHHRYTRKELEKLFARSTGFDRVVVTAKDAVKLRRLWPQNLADPLVAELEVEWEEGLDAFESLLPVVRAGGGEHSKPSEGSAEPSRSTFG